MNKELRNYSNQLFSWVTYSSKKHLNVYFSLVTMLNFKDKYEKRESLQEASSLSRREIWHSLISIMKKIHKGCYRSTYWAWSGQRFWKKWYELKLEEQHRKEVPCKDGGRDWGDEVTSQGALGARRAGWSKEQIVPWSLQRSTALLITWFQIFSLPKVLKLWDNKFLLFKQLQNLQNRCV